MFAKVFYQSTQELYKDALCVLIVNAIESTELF